jgi:ribosome-binding factor A
VTVAADAADVADRTTVGRHLARATGAIREEVAHAITRRKVPELVFEVV